jgi:hypothetical protein
MSKDNDVALREKNLKAICTNEPFDCNGCLGFNACRLRYKEVYGFYVGDTRA